MVASYLSAVQSYNIDHDWLVTVFEDLRLTQIFQDRQILFPKMKKIDSWLQNRFLSILQLQLQLLMTIWTLTLHLRLCGLGFLNLEKSLIPFLTSKNLLLLIWKSLNRIYELPKTINTLFFVSNKAQPISNLHEYKSFYQLSVSRLALLSLFANYFIIWNNQYLPPYLYYQIGSSVEFQLFLS